MTIPVNPVQIHPSFEQTPPVSTGLVLLLQSLARNREFDIQAQELQRQREQLDLAKRLAGPQYENSVLEAMKKKKELDRADDLLAANRRALTIYSGIVAQGKLDDPNAWATELQHTANDPDVHAALTALRDQGIKTATMAQQLSDLQHPKQTYSMQNTTGPGGPQIVGVNTANPRDVVGTGLTPQSAVPKPLTPTERSKLTDQAEFGAAALAAWKPVERLRRLNPNVEQEVGSILTSPTFVTAIPGLRSAGDAVEAVRRAGGSPAAQAYIRAKLQFLTQVERSTYPSARGITGVLLNQFKGMLLPGLDQQGNDQMRQNELQFLLTAQGRSDFDNHPELWQAAAKRHGVAGIDLQSLLQGGSGDTQLDSIRTRYPQQ